MPNQNKRTYYAKRVLRLHPSKNGLFGRMACLKMATMALSVINPVFYNVFINDVLLEGRLGRLWVVVAGYAGIYTLSFILSYFSKKATNTLLINITYNVKKRLMRICTKMRYEDYSKINTGEMKNRLENDVDSIETMVTVHCLDYYFEMAYVLVLSCIMVYLNWVLALVGMVMVPLSFLFTKFMARRANRLSSERRDYFGKYESFVWGELANYKEVKGNNLEEKMVGLFQGYWDKLGKLFVKLQVLWFANRTFVSVKDFFITKMNLYFIGGLLIIYGRMELSILLVFMNYYSKFFESISIVMDSKIQFSNEEVKIERIFSLLDYEMEEKAVQPIEDTRLSIRNVTFSYGAEGGAVLDRINVALKSKECVAIVGRSGCGKTTLTKLLARMYSPNEGTILMGGVDVKNIDEETYGSKIGVVMQEPSFFHMSVKENLLLAKRNATMEELYEVAKKARIYHFIERLPNKMDTLIGENGIKLSGGQRQRLAIARVLLKDPEIMVLDEATSALDGENETEILKVMDALYHKKTIVTISHRFSTIKNADRILVMDEGRIVGEGTHNELKETCRVYQSLFRNQYGA